jgi:drug/metabolite transporter (DMT)-like permease
MRVATIVAESMNYPPRSIAYAALVATAALWGSSAVAARGLLDALPPVTLAMLRWLVVVVCLLPFVWRERAAMVAAVRDDFRTYAVLALLGFAPQTCLVYLGLAGTTATLLGLLNSAIPVLIVAVLALFYGRRPTALEFGGLAVSTLGVAVILARGDLMALVTLRFSPSDLLLLVGMLVWAFYTVKLVERPKQVSLPAFVFIGAVLGLLFLAPVATAEIAMKGWPTITSGTALGILYLSTLPTLVASLLFGFGVARVGAVQAGIFTHLVPVFAATFAAVFIGERLHLFHGAGFLLVAGGALVCCLRAAPMLSSRAPARAPAKP